MSILRSIAVFLCGFFSFNVCFAQTPFLGPCPGSVSPMENFNATRYLGLWYEIERYPAIFQLGGKCVTAKYVPKTKNSIGVMNKQFNSLTGMVTRIEGIATIDGRRDVARLSVKFPSMPFDFAAPYWVVDTDYDNYAVVWGCNDFTYIHTRNAWILARQRHPPLNILEKAYAALDHNGISKAYFIRTDQNNCSNDENK